MTLLIIGAGEIGRALGALLEPKSGVEVLYCDKRPGAAMRQSTLEECAPRADIVFVCVPSEAVRDVSERIGPCLKPEATVVFVTKGLEKGTGRLCYEVFREVAPQAGRLVFLGGPMIAEELTGGKGGTGVVATESDEAYALLAPLFEGTSLRLERTADMFGAALSGVLKNVYAVALGVADGLGWPLEEKARLAMRAARELVGLAEAMGANRETATGPAGVGDLIATGMSRHSKNREAGEAIARSGTCRILSEGAVSLEPVLGRMRERGVPLEDYPLLAALKRAALEHGDPRSEFENLTGSG